MALRVMLHQFIIKEQLRLKSGQPSLGKISLLLSTVMTSIGMINQLMVALVIILSVSLPRRSNLASKRRLSSQKRALLAKLKKTHLCSSIKMPLMPCSTSTSRLSKTSILGPRHNLILLLSSSDATKRQWNKSSLE